MGYPTPAVEQDNPPHQNEIKQEEVLLVPLYMHWRCLR